MNIPKEIKILENETVNLIGDYDYWKAKEEREHINKIELEIKNQSGEVKEYEKI